MTSVTDIVDGRYRLVRLIGQGGMSDVYEAFDEAGGGTVAIKFVRSADPDLARRFAQEVRALGRLEHPGLVRLLTTGVADGHAYLVMELVDGTTLATGLRYGPLDPARTAALGATLADALAYVHSRGIVHRDVKPSNIMIGADGRARLGDFGIARLLDASAFTVAGTTLGTAAYMAPEQLEDHQVGVSADIWSLGIVLLECLTGHRIYQGSPTEVVARRLAGPVPLPPDLPVPWKLLLSGMLDHRPGERLTGGQVAALLDTAPFAEHWVPATVPDTDALAPTAAHDLTALAPGATSKLVDPDPTRVAPAVPAPTAATSPRSRRRSPLLLAAIAVAVAVAAAVALLLALGSSPAVLRPPTTTTHPRAASTTAPPTTTSTTTTTTTPSRGFASALAALLGDVASGESSGAIDRSDAQAISNQVEQAVTDEAAGKPNQAAGDLQQAATAIANGQQNGGISPDEATALQSDLTTLASALGLSAASTPPTTPAGPGATSGPGPGNGHAKKH